MSSAPQNTATDENARYKRAIRTAEELFKKVGFRAVTMELVAREANVAKATLYSYFKNKDELFLAVCARMAQLLRGAVEQALMKPNAPLDARLIDAVIAKQRPIFALVRGSAHAAELFTYTHSMAGEIFTGLDAAILEMLRAAMAEDPELSPHASQLARALYFGSAELARRSGSAAEMEVELNAFAATHLAGVRALAKRD
jgi:AcrR family transcriptional regulator